MFTTHHLEFTARAMTPLAIEAYAGASIRGALANALWDRFCTNKPAPACAACALVRVCPVAALVAPLREEGEHGNQQRPRPYTVRPPLGGPRTFEPGEVLSFGLT